MTFKMAILAAVLTLGATANAQQHENIQTPAQAIEALKEGNTRFITDNRTLPNQCKDHRKSLKKSQAPFAAIVTCSDSRVPAELLFDNGFGDLFVIRTAGNTVVDSSTQGSVDYAVNHLGVKLIVVLGHTNCGAIKAVVTSTGNDTPKCAHEASMQGELPTLIGKIADCIPQYKGKSESFDEAIMANVHAQSEKIAALPHVQAQMAEGKLAVVSALYDLKTGKVIFE